MGAVPHVMVGNFRLNTNQVATFGAAQLNLTLQNPNPAQYDITYLYTWDGERYLPWGNTSAAQQANASVAEYSPLMVNGTYSYGVQVVAFAANSQDLRNNCTSQGGRFDGVACDADVSSGVSTLGINDNKLTVFALNVGNANCLFGPYIVKLCDFNAELGVKALISGVNADVVLLSEVFNDNCNSDTRLTPFPGNVCNSDERARHNIPAASKQITRILPLTRYDYRCSESKYNSAKGGYYSGYECIAVKKGFVSFATSAVTTPYLQPITPNCEANPRMTAAGLNPQAVPAPSIGLDTGIWVAQLRAEGYAQPFYAATAHLSDPRKHLCRNAQITAFVDWYRATGQPKYILGGDFNTDPNYSLYRGFESSDRVPTHTGRASLTRKTVSAGIMLPRRWAPGSAIPWMTQNNPRLPFRFTFPPASHLITSSATLLRPTRRRKPRAPAGSVSLISIINQPCAV